MDYETCRSLPAMFLASAVRGGDKPFLWAKTGGKYQPISWAEAARTVNRLARGPAALGVESGERGALGSEDRREGDELGVPPRTGQNGPSPIWRS